MYAYLSTDLIGASEFWTGKEVEALAHALEALLTAPARVMGFAVSQGDSFQLECAAVHALRVALLFELLARAGGKPGARVAFAFQRERPDKSLPITVRTGPAYRAAGRGLRTMTDTDYRIRYFTSDEAEAGWQEAIKLCGLMTTRLTHRQAEVLRHVLHRPAAEQSDISETLGISQQAVSKHMRAGHMKQLATLVNAFETHASRLT